MRANDPIVLGVQDRQRHMWANLDYSYIQGKALSEVARGTMSQVLISRVLCDYVKKPFVNCSLSSALLNKLTSDQS